MTRTLNVHGGFHPNPGGFAVSTHFVLGTFQEDASKLLQPLQHKMLLVALADSANVPVESVHWASFSRNRTIVGVSGHVYFDATLMVDCSYDRSSMT
jgi:hypothetical protein